MIKGSLNYVANAFLFLLRKVIGIHLPSVCLVTTWDLMQFNLVLAPSEGQQKKNSTAPRIAA